MVRVCLVVFALLFGLAACSDSEGAPNPDIDDDDGGGGEEDCDVYTVPAYSIDGLWRSNIVVTTRRAGGETAEEFTGFRFAISSTGPASTVLGVGFLGEPDRLVIDLDYIEASAAHWTIAGELTLDGGQIHIRAEAGTSWTERDWDFGPLEAIPLPSTRSLPQVSLRDIDADLSYLHLDGRRP